MIEGEKLLQAVRNRLRDNLTNLPGTSSKSKLKSVSIMPNEMIPPYAGEEFIGIYGGRMVNDYPTATRSSRENYSISVGITRRIQAQPIDRLGDTIYTEDTDVYDRDRPSMLARARDIITLIDGITQVITDANELLSDDSDVSPGYCFMTPLALISADMQPRYVDEDHFFTPEDDNEFHKGLFIELSFGGAYFVVDHQTPT